MALLKCPDCGHDMSDKAQSCPNCGCPNHPKSLHEGNNAADSFSASGWDVDWNKPIGEIKRVEMPSSLTMGIKRYKCNDCGNKITLAHNEEQKCYMCGSTNLHYITPQEIAEEKRQTEERHRQWHFERRVHEMEQLGEELRRKSENPGGLPYFFPGW